MVSSRWVDPVSTTTHILVWAEVMRLHHITHLPVVVWMMDIILPPGKWMCQYTMGCTDTCSVDALAGSPSRLVQSHTA